MIKSDDQDIMAFSGIVSFVFIPFLLFMAIVAEIYFMVGILTTCSILWVAYLTWENKEYKLMKLRDLVIEIDDYKVTEIQESLED